MRYAFIVLVHLAIAALLHGSTSGSYLGLSASESSKIDSFLHSCQFVELPGPSSSGDTKNHETAVVLCLGGVHWQSSSISGGKKSLGYSSSSLVYLDPEDPKGPVVTPVIQTSECHNLERLGQTVVDISAFAKSDSVSQFLVFGGALQSGLTISRLSVQETLLKITVDRQNLSCTSERISGAYSNLDTGVYFPSPRLLHSAVLSGNKMIVHGGLDPKTGLVLSDIWHYDVELNTWARLGVSPQFRRFGHQSFLAAPNYPIAVFGGLPGSQHDNQDGVLFWNQASQSWIAKDSSSYQGVRGLLGHSVVKEPRPSTNHSTSPPVIFVGGQQVVNTESGKQTRNTVFITETVALTTLRITQLSAQPTSYGNITEQQYSQVFKVGRALYMLGGTALAQDPSKNSGTPATPPAYHVLSCLSVADGWSLRHRVPLLAQQQARDKDLAAGARLPQETWDRLRTPELVTRTARSRRVRARQSNTGPRPPRLHDRPSDTCRDGGRVLFTKSQEDGDASAELTCQELAWTHLPIGVLRSECQRDRDCRGMSVCLGSFCTCEGGLQRPNCLARGVRPFGLLVLSLGTAAAVFAFSRPQLKRSQFSRQLFVVYTATMATGVQRIAFETALCSRHSSLIMAGLVVLLSQATLNVMVSRDKVLHSILVTLHVYLMAKIAYDRADCVSDKTSLRIFITQVTSAFSGAGLGVALLHIWVLARFLIATSRAGEEHMQAYYSHDVSLSKAHSLIKHPERLKGASFSAKVAVLRRLISSERRTRRCLNLYISRDSVLHESFETMMNCSLAVLKSGMTVRFDDEGGIDLGGLKKEWFSLVIKELFDPAVALFKFADCDGYSMDVNSGSHINPNHLEYFEFAGTVLGKAILENIYLDVTLTRPLYKRLLGRSLESSDLEHVDPAYSRSLSYLLEHDLEGNLATMTFALDREEFGRLCSTELIPGGSKILVTDENKKEFVDKCVEYRLCFGTEEQVKALVKGFNKLFRKEWCAVLDANDLELLISGVAKIDVKDWKKNTEVSGFSRHSNVASWFWKLVSEFSDEERSKILQFVTGSARVPPGGFTGLTGVNGRQKFQLRRMVMDATHLPVAHTCFNILELPEYASMYDMELALRTMISVSGSVGFHIA